MTGNRNPPATLRKIISGGQTGVDRAALDAAAEAGLSTGGWCPRWRRAEDGPIDRRYPLRETPSPDYAQRTAWNVRDSDATLVLTMGPPGGGTALTLSQAEAGGRPWLVIDLGEGRLSRHASGLRDWLARQDVAVLNVAGPRASEAPRGYARTLALLRRVLGSGEGSAPERE